MSEQKIRDMFEAYKRKEISIPKLVSSCFRKEKWACEVLFDIIESNPKPDQIKGGLADNAKISHFDRAQLIKGIEIELEHTDDPYLALEIATDHLTEHKRYYIPFLENAEREMEKDEK